MGSKYLTRKGQELASRQVYTPETEAASVPGTVVHVRPPDLHIRDASLLQERDHKQ